MVLDCAIVRERLRELVRGEVAAQEGTDLRRHLARCPGCRHEEEAERLLDEALSARLPRPPAPAALRQRITSQLAERSPEAPAAPRSRRELPYLAAAAIALAGLSFAVGRATAIRSGEGDLLSDEVVTDHLRALASARPFDVESSNSHEVKPWFEGRLDFAPVVPGDEGEVRLLGGSVGYVGEHKAAVISYGVRRHKLTLIAFPRAGASGAQRAPLSGPPDLVSRRGFEVALWAAGDVTYALVGDISSDELAAIAAKFAAETRR